MSSPLVSICCCSYNHFDFISKTLESFLEQKTNFGFEILIHDDASTDGTIEIILSYAKMYPDIIRPLIQKDNKYSQGVRFMQNRYNFPRAKGKYLAICEGDDYWTDPNKLQKQVDFLDTNSDYNLCFHQVNKLYEDYTLVPHCNIKTNTVFCRKDLYSENIIPTCSVMFRNIERPDTEAKSGLTFGDWLLHLHYTSGGAKAFYFADSMGVYRIHKGGHWSTQNKISQIEQILNVCNYISENLVDTDEERVIFNRSHNNYYFILLRAYFKQFKIFKFIHLLSSWIFKYGIFRVVSIFLTYITKRF